MIGEAADCKAYDALISLPECAPNAFHAGKGYDPVSIRADLAERNIEVVIPGRSNRRVKSSMFGQLKINRAIAPRYDQLSNSFLSMVHLATAGYWLKFVHVT